MIKGGKIPLPPHAVIYHSSSCNQYTCCLLYTSLTISAVLYSIHHDVLCCHEWYLFHKVLFNNLWIYYQSIHHSEAEVKDSVYCKEALRY